MPEEMSDHPVPDKERFYDDEIAPALMEIARKCEERGINFTAMAEFAQGDVGTTLTSTAPEGAQFRLARSAMQSLGNVDTLLLALLRWHKEVGSKSMFLHQLDRVGRGHPS